MSAAPLWHIAETLQGIRADVDDGTAMVQMMKVKVENPEGFQVSA